MEYVDDISKVTSNHSSMENFKHNTTEILKPRDLNVNHDKTEQYIISWTNNEWRLCKYRGSILDTGEDINGRKILAITTANQLEIIFDNKKLTPETNMKHSEHMWAYFPLQLLSLDNNTFSNLKNINAFQRRVLMTYLCTKRKMAEYCQKWGRIQKNRSHRMEQHHLKTKIEMVWESNQSRQINTSKEGV